ncbi:MAG: hypothetical protein WCK88_06390 [bacterium]
MVVAQVTVAVVVVFLLDVVVVSVVRDQVVVAVVIMKQVLQRSDLVLVVRVLLSHEHMVAVDHQVVDMVVELGVVVSIVVGVAVVDLCKNNLVTSSICISRQIRRVQKKLQRMKFW